MHKCLFLVTQLQSGQEFAFPEDISNGCVVAMIGAAISFEPVVMTAHNDLKLAFNVQKPWWLDTLRLKLNWDGFRVLCILHNEQLLVLSIHHVYSNISLCGKMHEMIYAESVLFLSFTLSPS